MLDLITHWGLVGVLVIAGPVIAYLLHRAESQQSLVFGKTVPPRSHCTAFYPTQGPDRVVDWQAE